MRRIGIVRFDSCQDIFVFQTIIGRVRNICMNRGFQVYLLFHFVGIVIYSDVPEKIRGKGKVSIRRGKRKSK